MGELATSQHAAAAAAAAKQASSVLRADLQHFAN